MDRKQIHARIAELGIIPGIRSTSAGNARFIVDALHEGGISIVEITMTVPEALTVIRDLVRSNPQLVVGAGTVLDLETANCALDAGAHFLTAPGLSIPLVEAAHQANVVVFPGVLTPTEVMLACAAGSDFVKVFPCSQMGGDAYIRALRSPFPQVSFIAAGGINQKTAAHYIHSGVAAIGIGSALMPPEAVEQRQGRVLVELAHRFVRIVKQARSEMNGHFE